MAAGLRGPLLTTFAILFALLAVSNLLKPFQLGGETTGFVFLGQRMSGLWNAVLGPLFGIYLAVYAWGIIRMRRFAMRMGLIYALYVVLNLVLWNVRSDDPFEIGVVLGVVYFVVAIGVSAGAAVISRGVRTSSREFAAACVGDRARRSCISTRRARGTGRRSR